MLVSKLFLIIITKNFLNYINCVCLVRDAYDRRVLRIQAQQVSTNKQEISGLLTTEYKIQFCQENYGRRLNSTALNYAILIASKNASSNQCCLLCFENNKCDYYYQKDLTDEISLCSLFDFNNTPFKWHNFLIRLA